MPHIHATGNVKPADLVNSHLRQIAAQTGALACWSADVWDCGESIGPLEAVALIQPGTAHVSIWTAFEDDGPDDTTYKSISVFRQIHADVKEQMAERVQEI